MRTVAIICGGRDLRWQHAHEEFLGTCHAAHNMIYVLVGSNAQRGGRPYGADAHAYAWAARNGIERLCKDANWGGHGRAAGPFRNAALLDIQAWLAQCFQAERAVLALPGGRGTLDMCQQAQVAGVPVVRYEAQRPLAEGVLL